MRRWWRPSFKGTRVCEPQRVPLAHEHGPVVDRQLETAPALGREEVGARLRRPQLAVPVETRLAQARQRLKVTTDDVDRSGRELRERLVALGDPGGKPCGGAPGNEQAEARRGHRQPRQERPGAVPRVRRPAAEGRQHRKEDHPGEQSQGTLGQPQQAGEEARRGSARGEGGPSREGRGRPTWRGGPAARGGGTRRDSKALVGGQTSPRGVLPGGASGALTAEGPRPYLATLPSHGKSDPEARRRCGTAGDRGAPSGNEPGGRGPSRLHSRDRGPAHLREGVRGHLDPGHRRRRGPDQGGPLSPHPQQGAPAPRDPELRDGRVRGDASSTR